MSTQDSVQELARIRKENQEYEDHLERVKKRVLAKDELLRAMAASSSDSEMDQDAEFHYFHQSQMDTDFFKGFPKKPYNFFLQEELLKLEKKEIFDISDICSVKEFKRWVIVFLSYHAGVNFLHQFLIKNIGNEKFQENEKDKADFMNLIGTILYIKVTISDRSQLIVFQKHLSDKEIEQYSNPNQGEEEEINKTFQKVATTIKELKEFWNFYLSNLSKEEEEVEAEKAGEGKTLPLSSETSSSESSSLEKLSSATLTSSIENDKKKPEPKMDDKKKEERQKNITYITQYLTPRNLSGQTAPV